MRFTVFLIVSVLTLFISTRTNAQVDSSILADFHRIKELIENDSVNTLAALIQYPLRRDNPLPNISSAKEFAQYYPTLIDSTFKVEMESFQDSDIFETSVGFAIENGDIWIDDSGIILAINYSSGKEKKLKQQISEKIKKEMYPSVRNWDQNILVCESSKYLFRIDYVGDSIRFVAWRAEKKMSEKPDIILNDGSSTPQGTMGGWIWTFKDSDNEYIVEDNEMCPDDAPEDCGYFLILKHKDKEKYRDKCIPTK